MRANFPIALCLATGCASSAPAPAASQATLARGAISPASPVGRRINPPGLPKPNGYSHVVEVGSGRTVYISGQVALDHDGKLVGDGDFQAQAEQVFANLNEALQAVQGNFGNVVKLTFFVTQLTPESLSSLREVRDRHVDPAHAPASSLVQVSSLFRRELMLEIEAIAVIPD